jgi:hypothetical protein
MDYDVNQARYLGGYRLEITFKNGKSGIVDFEKFIRKGGIFARLAKLDYFKQFDINRELGVITWGNEVDIAPETLYTEATKEPFPECTVEEKSYIESQNSKTIRYTGQSYPDFDEILQTILKDEGWELSGRGYNPKNNIRELIFIKRKRHIKCKLERQKLPFIAWRRWGMKNHSEKRKPMLNA